MRHNFKKLEIWKRSMRFVKEIYTLSKNFPAEEKYGLTSQIRRAAVSMPSNIAEGCGRSTNPQLVHFLDHSIGSSCEVETQLYLSFAFEYINKIDLNRLTKEVEEIRMMMIKFQSKL